MPTIVTPMRTQGFHTRLMLAIAGALGLVVTLGRPWYAMAPLADPNQPGNGDINGPQRPVPGHAALGDRQRRLHRLGGAGSVGARARRAGGHRRLGALACLAPALQSLGRDLMRYGALAVFAIALWKLFDTPGPNAAMEPRLGAMIGAGCALLLVVSALGAASAPLRRHTAHGSYEAPTTT